MFVAPSEYYTFRLWPYRKKILPLKFIRIFPRTETSCIVGGPHVADKACRWGIYRSEQGRSIFHVFHLPLWWPWIKSSHVPFSSNVGSFRRPRKLLRSTWLSKIRSMKNPEKRRSKCYDGATCTGSLSSSNPSRTSQGIQWWMIRH